MISAQPNNRPLDSTPMTNGRSEKPSQRLRTVVVDDNVDAAESLADLLRMLGHDVQVAHDGPGGLAVARAAKADVVLLDIGLPGMSGYEVARRLRADPDFTALLVAVSGYGREEDRHQSREAGIEHHFVKPLDFRQLQLLFDHVCTSRTQLQ
jgi:CheY-like chemotaxis protein